LKSSFLNIVPYLAVYFEHLYKDDRLMDIVIYGGGNGHGVGMSQYGVAGMIKAGYSLDEIIGHYYEGSNVFSIK